MFNFLPLAILVQFSKVPNCCMLVNAILQSVPSISTNDPIATIIPLCAVICLGLYKEASVDLKKRKGDQEENNQNFKRLVFEEATYDGVMVPVDTSADQLKVGDIIRVFDGQILPADCVVLSTSIDN